MVENIQTLAVWVLFRGTTYEGGKVISVHSSRESAEAAEKVYRIENALTLANCDYIEVEEHRVIL